MVENPLYRRAWRAFRGRFLHEPELVVRAPGRVNLIGEHTDYNDGFVMPVAVDRAAWVAAGRRPDSVAVLRALDMGKDEVSFGVDKVPPSVGGWSDYPRGVAWAFLERGLRPPGMDAVLTSDVPVGAGMSSSAAVELAFAYAWNHFGEFELDRDALAFLCKGAENEYVGVACGIMDQMIGACGREGHAMLLDTRTMERHYIPLPGDVTIVVADSQVRRSLAGSEYNVRRGQCEEAVRLLREPLPEIEALRDVSPEALREHGDLLPEVVLRRARHVVSENARVYGVARAFYRKDLEAVGALLLEGHRSLRDDYEVSVPELDALVEAAVEVPGCYGARLTGAGFGGCIIALAESEAVPELERHLVASYSEEFGKEPAVYAVSSARGVDAVEK
jgi:galactokinase